MADLGTLTTIQDSLSGVPVTIICKDASNYNNLVELYKIQGEVQVETVPTGPLLVRLYNRSNGSFISSTLSDIDGSFIFENIPSTPSNLFVIAFDSTSSPAYNAVIFDRVSPVSMV